MSPAALLANPWVLLAVAVAWVASMAGAAYTGKQYADGQHASAELARQQVLEATRQANREFADQVAIDVGAAILNIRVNNRTIVNEVRHEREIHRVLDNPDCRLPGSTAGVLNRARGAQDGSGAGKPAAALPAARGDQTGNAAR